MHNPFGTVLVGSLCACTAVWGEGGPDAGTAPRVDAQNADPSGDCDGGDLSCTAWVLASAPVATIQSMETAPIHPERSARFLIGVELCAGDEVAEWSYAPTLENEYMILAVTLWRKEGTFCDAPEIVERPTTIRFPYPGSWTLYYGALQQVVEVEPAPSGTCGSPAGECQRDCDCDLHQACLSGSSAGGAFLRCARPCEFDRDCRGEGVCGTAADGLADVCLADVDECAPPERPCPGGFECQDGSCQPTFELNQYSRHGCSCDSECEAPLRCVVPGSWCQPPYVCANPEAGSPEGELPPGRCEMVCHTSSDGWCQGPHTCGLASIEGDTGVCEWVGE